MNSDLLLPYSYFWDLSHVPGALYGHQLARIPSLLPDLVLVGTILACTASVRWTVLLYGGFQMLAFLHIGGFVASRLARTSFVRGFAALGWVFSVLLLTEAWTISGSILMNVFVPLDHVGPFLVVTLAVWAASEDVLEPRRRLKLIVGFSCFYFMCRIGCSRSSW